MAGNDGAYISRAGVARGRAGGEQGTMTPAAANSATRPRAGGAPWPLPRASMPPSQRRRTSRTMPPPWRQQQRPPRRGAARTPSVVRDRSYTKRPRAAAARWGHGRRRTARRDGARGVARRRARANAAVLRQQGGQARAPARGARRRGRTSCSRRGVRGVQAAARARCARRGAA